jgi:hypothetical protein
MSYLRYLCLFGSSLPPVVCRKAIRLIVLFVGWFMSYCVVCRMAQVLLCCL